MPKQIQIGDNMFHCKLLMTNSQQNIRRISARWTVVTAIVSRLLQNNFEPPSTSVKTYSHRQILKQCMTRWLNIWPNIQRNMNTSKLWHIHNNTKVLLESQWLISDRRVPKTRIECKWTYARSRFNWVWTSFYPQLLIIEHTHTNNKADLSTPDIKMTFL